jgi:hypothetical protein
MGDERRQKLVKAGAPLLADALLELAEHTAAAERLVERLTASPIAAVTKIKKRLAALKRGTRFIDWRGSRNFARELEELLRDLRAGVHDPATGLSLVAAFYECDSAILGRCDDSDGTVGDVFRHDARELFMHYAAESDDKEAVMALILKLAFTDDNSLRFPLLASASACLPEPLLRRMVLEIQGWRKPAHNEYEQLHCSLLIESLARQLGDVRLFTETRLASRPQVTAASCLDIARVHLERGEVDAAAGWLEKVPPEERFQREEREELWQEVYQHRGDTAALAALLERRFAEYPSRDTLEELLAVVGEAERERILAAARVRIREDARFHPGHVRFLLEVGDPAAAAGYLLARTDGLDGRMYERLLPLAKAMEKAGQPLAAVILYRALLVSILERGYAKAYPHAARYLHKLDMLATGISDWQGVDGHNAFVAMLRATHSRKTSFWAKVTE